MANSDHNQVGTFSPKCGQLSDDRRVASAEGTGANSFAFSESQIPVGVQFSVKILEKGSFYVSPISTSSRPHPLHGYRCCACSPLLPSLYTVMALKVELDINQLLVT